MKTKSALFLMLALGAAAGVGCSGGAGAPGVTPPAAHTISKTPQTVSVKIVVPAASRTATAAIRRRMAIAEGTDGIRLAVYRNPHASNPTPVLTTAFDISQTSSSCTTNSDTSRTCALSLTLAPGTYDIDAATYDAAPVSGTIPGTAHALGLAAMIGFSVTQGAANALNLSINGIAAGVSLTLPIPNVRGLDAVTQQAAVDVLDADGNTIVSNGYVDGAGNPVTVALRDSASTGLVSFTPATIATPPPNGVTVTYAPGPALTVTDVTNGLQIPLAAALSIGPSSTTTLNVASSVTPILLPSPAAHGIAADANKVYVPLAMPSQLPQLAEISIATHIVTSVPDAQPSSGPLPAPYDIAVGSDGRLWMTDQFRSVLDISNTAGTSFSTVTIPTGTGTGIVAAGGYLEALVPSIAPGLGLFESTTTGTTARYSIADVPAAIAYTGGAVYLTEPSAIERVVPGSGSTGTAPIPTSNSSPLGITADTAGNLWFAETAAKQIGEFNPSPLPIVEYSAGGASPLYIVQGPDGNLWFDFTSPYSGIGRITTAGTNPTLFPLPAGTAPGEMTVAGGLIWVVDTSSSDEVFAIQP
jgi:streptogramin lyase